MSVLYASLSPAERPSFLSDRARATETTSSARRRAVPTTVSATASSRLDQALERVVPRVAPHGALATHQGIRRKLLKTHPLPDAFPPAPASWAGRYAKMARDDDLAWPTIDILEEVVRAFLDPVLARRALPCSPFLFLFDVYRFG